MKNNNDYKRNRILFDFESIVDLKLSYIKKYLADHGKIVLHDSQLNALKFNRMYIYQDPLSLIEIEDRQSINLDNPEYPLFTGMKLLIEQYIKKSNGLITPIVLCKDEFQQRIIKKSIPDVNTLIGSRDKVKTINFSRIVIADPKHCLEFRDPVTVDFMILNFRENFDKDNPDLLDKDVLIQIGDVNSFTIAKAYPEIPNPKG